MTSIIDTKITEYIAGKPWLKALLAIAMSLLGVAKGRGWFAKRYGIE